MNSGKFDFSLWESIVAEKEKKREENRQAMLEKAVSLLSRYFRDKKVGKVYLVGSILKQNHFSESSDIDIAVERLAEPYFATLASLEDLLGREIDLVELETSSLRETFERTGQRIL